MFWLSCGNSEALGLTHQLFQNPSAIRFDVRRPAKYEIEGILIGEERHTDRSFKTYVQGEAFR